MDPVAYDQKAEALAQRYQGRTDVLIRDAGRWVRFGYLALLSMAVAVTALGIVVFTAGVFIVDFGIVLLILGGLIIVWGLYQLGHLMVLGPAAPPAQGIAVPRQAAPRLHEAVDQLCLNMQIPPPRKILLDAQWNAAIWSFPQSLFATQSQAELVLGWPLMAAMTEDEFCSVLAHECAHLRHSDWRSSFRVSRVCQAWELLFERWRKSNSSLVRQLLNGLAQGFLSWYFPRLKMRADLLSRHNEFQADLEAAQATHSDVTQSALWKLGYFGLQLDDTWRKTLARHVTDCHQPPQQWAPWLLQELKEIVSHPDQRKLSQLRLQTSSSTSSHPSIRERLLALGTSPQSLEVRPVPELPSPELSACNFFQSDLFSDLLEPYLNGQLLPTWQHLRRHHARIVASSCSSTDLPSDPVQLWPLLETYLQAHDLTSAERIVRHLLAIRPDDQRAQWVLGKILVEENDDEGEALLLGLLESHSYDWALPAAESLSDYYQQNNLRESLESLRPTIQSFSSLKQQDQKARINISPSDTFLPHGLGESDLRKVVQMLDRLPHCHQVWLVEKPMIHFPEQRLYVMALDSLKPDSARPAAYLRETRNDSLVTQVMLQWPLKEQVFVVHPTGQFSRAARKLMKQDHHLIFDRSVQR